MFLTLPFFIFKGVAATWNSNVASGSWTSASSWTNQTGTPNLGSNANNWAVIRNGHTITKSGNLRFGVRGNIEIQSGGTLRITGNLEFDSQAKIYVRSGGTLIVDGICRGSSASGNNFMQNNSLIQIDEGGTATFGGDVKPAQGSDLIFNGNVTVNGNVFGDGSGTTITVGANADVDINGNLTINNNVVANVYGDIEVNNLTSNGGGSPYNLYSGTTTVNNTLTIQNNGKVDGTGGIITWSTANINPSCSGAFLRCASGTKYDTKGGTCPTGWSPPPANPIALAPCSSPCSVVDPGTISANQTICEGSEVVAFTSTLAASGGDGTNYDYQWMISTTNATSGFSNIVGATNETYDHGVLTETTWFKRMVTSGICPTGTTDAIEITVDPTTIKGSVSADATVCSSSNGATLTLSGNTGAVVKWIENVNNGGWTDIGNAGSSTISYNNLTQSTNYAAVVKSGECPSDTSDAAIISVAPISVGGTVSSDATVCNGSNTGTLTLSGQTGDVVKWQKNVAGGGWTDIVNSNTTETYTNITQETQYRAVVQSSVCPSINSSEVTLSIVNALTAGNIGSAQTIDFGNAPAALTNDVDATGGGGFTYQWQSSTNGVSFTDIGGATLSTYAPGALNNDTWFRRAAIPVASCATEFTASVKITVELNLSCGDTPPTLVNIASPSGGTGTYTYVWQSSPDNVNWTTISGEISETYDPPNPGATTYYRRGVSSGACGPLYTEGKLATISTSGTGPGGTSGDLIVWLKADEGTDNISTQWEDQSGNNNHYSTANGPTLVANGDASSNYNPYVKILDGGFNAPAGAALGSEYTIFIVAKKLPSDDNGRIFDGHIGDYSWGYWGQYSKAINTNNSPAKHNSLPATTLGATEKMVQTFIRQSNGALEHRVNGSNLENYVTSADPTGVRININQGAFAATEGSDAVVYEMIVYNAALSLNDVKRSESYLLTKYGLNENINYLSSNSDVVYNVSTYPNDIIGIGKECYFLQKQSQSEGDSLIIFIDNLAASNKTNTGTISNNVSYVMIGHDNGLLGETASSNAEIPPAGTDGYNVTSRLEREWKVTNTNFDENYSLELEILDQSGINSLNDLCLLVDDDGDFTSGCRVYSNLDGITFSFGSIIINGLGKSIIPMGSTRFITLASKNLVTSLPVELISFDAIKNGEITDLYWATGSEINSSHFLIEKSLDGINWYSIGIAPAAGNSQEEITYNFTDKDGCNTGVCFYRLKQVDLDDTFAYSELRLIENGGSSKNIGIEVYPVPATSHVNVTFENDVNEKVFVNIYNAQGQIVHQTKLSSVVGKSTFRLPLVNWESGIYYLRVFNEFGNYKAGTPFNKL